MPDSVHSGLAFLICFYSLFEFLLKRIVLVNRGAVMRAIGLLITLLAGLSGWASLVFTCAVTMFALIYLACEVGESALQRRSPNRILEMFLGRQLISALGLVAVWGLAARTSPHEWFVDTLAAIAIFAGREVHTMQWSSIAAVASGYLFAVDGGTKIVRGILNKFPGLYTAVTQKLNVEMATGESENAGEWIGILERLIALTFVLTGNMTAVAFALTAKSIARFKELEDKQFSEYYILGTSASLVVPLVAGMVIRLLFGF